ncbi:MAG: MoxR family ATPase [Candidatus Eremiobacteraeota bacterium]|nr:MoxR family ATPase [Candidatus Eremiobacteraeota bacterium]
MTSATTERESKKFELTEALAGEAKQATERLTEEIQNIIVGQKSAVRRVLVGLLARGHILLEGVPGLAKTLMLKTLADTLKATFHRIQFTPDLLPADLTGTSVYNPGSGEFSIKKGPLFANLILADEVNRAPAKVQSALLEAMEEQQVTIGDETMSLPQPFLVMATQNPIEQEGTYPLPEAQVDRFMLKVLVDFPRRSEEAAIIDRMTAPTPPEARAVLKPDEIMTLQAMVPHVYLDDRVKNYILDLVFATREPQSVGLEKLIETGVSPRASLALVKSARAHALLEGRPFATPDDVKALVHEVFRHRLLLSYEALAEGWTPDRVIDSILQKVNVP